MQAPLYILVLFLALASSVASAYDPSPLQDFCVGINDTKNGVFVNGKFCKDPNLVEAQDFFFSGLDKAGDTNNKLGSRVTTVFADQLLGLNTLGISLVRIDYEPEGVNPPHIHPRASEILVVLEGTLYVGFVASNQNNHRLFTKVLEKGDLFVFPLGMVHFQLNIGNRNAVAYAALSSQTPGIITVANTIFGSEPSIKPEVLTKAFQLDKNIVETLQHKSWFDNT